MPKIGQRVRPVTDYENEAVACMCCGHIRPKGREETWCVPCSNIGHNFRLFGVNELRWIAARNKRDGYKEVSVRQLKWADELAEYDLGS